MKRLTAWLLLAAMVLSFCACSGAQEEQEIPADTTAVETSEAPTEPAQMQMPAAEENLFLKASSVTFSLVGESEDIYLGVAPREQVLWESDDPSVVSVENGVLTANAVGTTTIRATCGDKQLQCTAGCLAQTREELDALEPEVLKQPKRLPPEVDLEPVCTWFDDAAILGDSITYFLWQSESQNNYLGDMQFVTRQGISIFSLVRRYKNMYFQGKEMYIEDVAAQCGAERIYIMLGCLDFQFPEARDALMDSWNTLLDRIAEKSPELEVVIISNIPCYTEKTTPNEVNTLLPEVTRQLRQLAADRGYGFLDLGYYIEDHLGRMPEVYCKDEYHMNDEGSLVWMKILRYYAQYESEGGVLA